VESVSVGTVDVNFNGKTEKRKALYGVLDVTDNAKALNDANQKVYPSIEILDNFGGKGFAYLGGLALTDSPAAIATERMKFNRQLPGSIKYSSDTAALLEFEEDACTPEAKGMMASMGAMFDKFTAALSPAPKVDPVDLPADPAKPAAFDFSALRPMFDEMVQTFSTSLENIRKEFREETDRIALQVQKQGEEQEHTPAGNFSRRQPAGGGGASNYDGVW
jgi:hypothetical protein